VTRECAKTALGNKVAARGANIFFIVTRECAKTALGNLRFFFIPPSFTQLGDP